MCIYIYIFIYLFMCVCYVLMQRHNLHNISMYMYTHTHIYIYIYMYLCIFYTYIECIRDQAPVSVFAGCSLVSPHGQEPPRPSRTESELRAFLPTTWWSALAHPRSNPPKLAVFQSFSSPSSHQQGATPKKQEAPRRGGSWDVDVIALVKTFPPENFS